MVLQCMYTEAFMVLWKVNLIFCFKLTRARCKDKIMPITS